MSNGNPRMTNVLANVKVGGVRKVVNGDYDALINKPMINGHVLEGDKTAEELGIHGGSGTEDYEELRNRPKINHVELTGDMSLEDLGIPTEAMGYDFAEGDVPGAISVTPEGGTEQSVQVHGLKDFCFQEALTDEEILTILEAEDPDGDSDAETEDAPED